MRPPPARAFVSQLMALTLLLLVFSGSLGLGAVWVRQEISGTANRSHAIENKIADVERRLDEANANVASALNVSALLQQNQVMLLGLTLPHEAQIVRVDESSEDRLAAKNNRDAFHTQTARVGSTGASAGKPYSINFLTASLR